MTTAELVKTAVSRFLAQQIETKTEKLQKQLVKAKEDNKPDEVAKLQGEIDEICQKFERDTWLANAVNTMAKQLNFGTHISKGIHPDAKGDNVSFTPVKTLDVALVGTHNLINLALDANGNAAALPLATFFDFDAADGLKIRDLIINDDVDFIGALSNDKTTAGDYHAKFKQALQGNADTPSTHERNKQLLWAVNADTAYGLDDLHYINVIPLYPSAFSYEFFLKINQLRYSDDNKKALEARFKANAKHCPYVTLPNVATVQLGGSKPQNISQLMSRQGGRNYLLPSLPPKVTQSRDFVLSKFANNFFHSKTLMYHVQADFELIAEVINDVRNNIDVRNKRKDAIDCMLHRIFALAQGLQKQPAGWSIDYALPLAQKIWLDPQRADLPNEEAFAQEKQKNEWQKQIIQDFADWLNHELRQRFEKIRHTFADAEHREWQREIEQMVDMYQRTGQGIFL